MSLVHDELARFSAWFWPTLVTHLWQATLFTMLVLLATLALKRGPARVRCALWLLAALKFMVPAALLALLARLAGVAELFGGGSTKAMLFFQQLIEPFAFLGRYEITVDAGSAGHAEIYCALTIIWLAGSIALFAVWLWRRRASAQFVKRAVRLDVGREIEALERARRRLRMKDKPSLLLSPDRMEPGVWGILRPVIVLPEAIVEHLSEEELETMLSHELMHIKRRDNFSGHMQAALCCLFWFHPLVWLINHRLLAEREQACDEKVLELGGAPEAYASSILKVVRFCNGWRMAGASGATGSNLRRRIKNIMDGNTKRRFTVWQRALCAGLAALAVILSVAGGLFGFGETGGAHAVESKGERSVSAAATRGQDKMTKGKPVSIPQPVYPEEAKKKGIFGTVEVEIEINEEGKVSSARATAGPVELRASAEEAAGKAVFEPTTVNNKPVKVSGSLSFKFALDKKEGEN